MKYLYILLLLYARSLCGVETVDFNTFNALDHDLFIRDYQGKDVEIRGFLYKGDDGNYLLAEQPDLKSCCLKPGGSKKALQVEGMGLSPFVGTQVTLKGVLYTDPKIESSDIILLAAFPSEDDDSKYVLFAMCLFALLLISTMVYWIWSNKRLR